MLRILFYAAAVHSILIAPRGTKGITLSRNDSASGAIIRKNRKSKEAQNMSNRKVIIYIAASLDGYIATKEESLDWLFQVEGEGDNGYSAFYETVDAVLMGKKTYDWILNQELPEFPYKGKETYVFSRTAAGSTEDVTFISDGITSLIADLKKQSGKNIWLVGGGELIALFIKEQLVDELIVTIAPAVIGNGIPLFKEGEYKLDLSLKGTKTFNQFVELYYEVKK